MALRSLGSSLLAKNRPGTVYRDQKEKQIEKPVLPEKGEIGTVRRELVQEPLERKVPPGSDKVVTAKPTVDETSVPGEAVPQQSTPNLLAGNVGRVVGFPTSAPAQAGGQFTQGVAPNSPPSVAASTPRVASQAAPGGRAATSISQGAAPGAAPARVTGGEVRGAQTSAQAPDTVKRVGFLPSVFSTLSGRVLADDPGKPPEVSEAQGYGDTGVTRSGGNVEFTPTTGQFVSGAIGKLIDSVGKAIGNPLPEKNVSERLQTFGGAVQPAVEGKGSVSKALRSRGYTTSNIKNQAEAFVPWLRSLFGR